ncbi:MAG: branched-chain amino acid aminotransferase [Kiloniellaceae bacterium]
MTAIHYLDGQWVEGNPLILGPMTHATWMASVVFDGARAFGGVTPDLDLHCQRLIDSAHAFGMTPLLSAGEVLEIAQEGIARFASGAELYIRPMFWAENGAGQFFVMPDPDSTRFCCTVHEVPLPRPGDLSVCLSSIRRPTPSMAPTMAKAACLYPNSGRALLEAAERGFDNAVVLDANDNVAELATANIWLVKDGAAHTPVPNGTFLCGITRNRVAKLLRKAGVPVYERTITWDEVLEADEVFTTGNLAKVLPITRVESRDLRPGPIYTKAREIYFEWAYKG